VADDPAAPGPAADGNGAGLESRVASLETGQASILGKLDEALGFLSKTPDKPAEAEPAGHASSIADEIRRQLDARDKAKPKAEPAAPKPAELAEKQPKAPVRRVTKAIWGGDD
jgi:hypothetical protein